jgi:putative MATE family efflux protein
MAAWMALQAGYNLVNAFWLGRLSTEALAAQSLSVPFFFIVQALVQSFAMAGISVLAQYTGAGRHYEADRAAGQMFLLLTVVSVVLTLPLVVFSPHLLRMVMAPEETLADGTAYMRIAMLALPFMAFSSGYGAALRALGNTTTIVSIGVKANILNAVLDPILIFGWLGMPAMGVSGAAIGTLVANILSALLCYRHLHRGHVGLRIRAEDLRPDRKMLVSIARIAWPLTINGSSDSWGFFFFRIIINALGATVLTAYTVCFRVLNVFTMPAAAMAFAATPIVGQAIGAGKPELARQAVLRSTWLTGKILLLPMLLLMVFGQQVASLFTRDQAVIKEAARFFIVVPISAYAFQVITVMSSAFVGSGHTRASMVISVVRQIRLPAAFVFVLTLGMGSMGIYWGMVAGNVLGAVLTLWIFLQGRWQKATVLGLHDGEAKPPADGEA